MADRGVLIEARGSGTGPAPEFQRLSTVLIVEDHEFAIRALVAMLQRLAGAVLTSRRGSEATRMCERHPGCIDLLVGAVPCIGRYTDAAVQRIYAARPGMPTLLVSTQSLAAAVEAGYIDPVQIRQRRTAFIQKPFAFSTFAASVQAARNIAGPRDRRQG